jgi:hypothetical protein
MHLSLPRAATVRAREVRASPNASRNVKCTVAYDSDDELDEEERQERPPTPHEAKEILKLGQAARGRIKKRAERTLPDWFLISDALWLGNPAPSSTGSSRSGAGRTSSARSMNGVTPRFILSHLFWLRDRREAVLGWFNHLTPGEQTHRPIQQPPTVATRHTCRSWRMPRQWRTGPTSRRSPLVVQARLASNAARYARI